MGVSSLGKFKIFEEQIKPSLPFSGNVTYDCWVVNKAYFCIAMSHFDNLKLHGLPRLGFIQESEVFA